MNEKLNNYFDSLFEGAPNTPEVKDLRDEIYQNTLDKYNDLLSQGNSKDSAFTKAVSGIGDIEELIENVSTKKNDNFTVYYTNYYTDSDIENNRSFCNMTLTVSVVIFILSIIPTVIFDNGLGAALFLVIFAAAVGLMVYRNKMTIDEKQFSLTIDKLKKTKGEDYTKEQFEKSRSTSAVLLAVSIALYIVSPALMIYVTDEARVSRDLEILATTATLVIIAIATGIIVFYNKTKIKLASANEDSVTEEVKEWSKKEENAKKIQKSIDIALFVSAAVIYFFISVATSAWYITWIIWLMAFVIYKIICLCIEYSKCKKE